MHRCSVSKLLRRVLELAGGVMEEFSNPSGPRKELVNSHSSELMQLMKDIQVTLREEIKSACEYRPFEKLCGLKRIMDISVQQDAIRPNTIPQEANQSVMWFEKNEIWLCGV
ncbi:mediator of RNA polymerase II transcription subunit 11-like protein isoform X1 [Tanacetum coccineum]